MSFNMFEGGRRVAFSLKVLWVMFTVVAIIRYRPPHSVDSFLVQAVGLIVGWVAFTLVFAGIGWIVRGFLGIPRGKDNAEISTFSNSAAELPKQS